MPRKKVSTKKAPPKKDTRKEVGSPKKAQQSDVMRWVEEMGKSQRYKGKAQIRSAGSLTSSYTLRRPCGILGLDIGLGGGFHGGGGTQIYGSESVGKTHLAYKVGANIQKNYGEDAAIMIYSTEIKPDKGFARQAEMCVAYSDEEIKEYSKLRVKGGLPPFTEDEEADLKKQIGDVVVVVSDTADTGLATVKDALEMGGFQLIIIESLGALLPAAQEERVIGDMKVGGSASLITDFQNKIYPLFMMEREDGSSLSTTLIGINQARSKIGYTGRGPSVKPAADAFAWRHGQLASIELSRGPDLKNSDKEVIGKDVRWKLTKGKAGTHDGKGGEFAYFHIDKREPVFWKDVLQYWVGGVDTISEAVNTGITLGVINRAGSWLTWEDVKGQGVEAFSKSLSSDKELVRKFWDECYKAAGILVKFR